MTYVTMRQRKEIRKKKCRLFCTILCTSKETMPTEERGQIGMVKPSGWHTVKYPDVIDRLEFFFYLTISIILQFHRITPLQNSFKAGSIQGTNELIMYLDTLTITDNYISNMRKSENKNEKTLIF